MISRPFCLAALASLAVFQLPFLSALQAESYRYMSGSEIRQLLENKTIKQVDDQYYAFYTPNGQVRALYVNAEETGSWTVENSQVCHRWDTWNKGKRACFGVIPGQQGAYRFQNVQSSEGFNFVLESGNYRGL